MIGHQVPAALGAILTLAEVRFLERRDVLVTRCDADGFRFPERERIHRPARPRTAGPAMTITHALR